MKARARCRRLKSFDDAMRLGYSECERWTLLAWRFVPSANEFGMAAREGRVRQLDRFIVDEMEVLWVSIAESIVSLS